MLNARDDSVGNGGILEQAAKGVRKYNSKYVTPRTNRVWKRRRKNNKSSKKNGKDSNFE